LLLTVPDPPESAIFDVQPSAAIDFAHGVVMPAERLFIAIPLPVPLRNQLMGLFDPLRSIVWTRPEQLHLTLRFLGAVDAECFDPIAAALERVRVEPFLLSLSSVGAFPPRGAARIIWVGVGHGHPRLNQLRQQIDDALLATGLPVDVRLFHPHVTLGRVKNDAAPGAAIEFLKRHRDFEGAPFRAEAFHLCASELRPGGAVHTLKREFRL
jgi:2'-5' RNA ligase